MSVPVLAVPPAAPADALVRIMRNNAIGALPVTDDSGRAVGIVTASDLANTIQGAQQFTAAEIMSRPPHCIDIDASIATIEEVFERWQIGHLIVLHDDQLAGIVSATDLARHAASETPGGRRMAPDDVLSNLIVAHLRAKEPSLSEFPDFSVCNGIVQFWRAPPNAEELEAVMKAAVAAQQV